jgi:hypothetical protein
MPLFPAQRKQFAAAAKAAQRLSLPSPWARPSLAGTKNIFLVRSAAPDILRRCLKQLRSLAPRARLHILSHRRDAAMVRALLQPRDIFYPYTAGGNYSAANCTAVIAKIKKARPDTFVMLSNNVYGYPHIAEILTALGARHIHLFNVNERWYRSSAAELATKNAYSSLYLSICKLLYNE